MQRVGPNVSPAIAASVICLALGAVAGYGARYFIEQPTGMAGARSAPGGGGPPGGMMGGGRGGGGGGGYGGGRGGGGYGGGGFGGPPSGGMALARLVRNLETIETAQGKGLTPAQAKQILPMLNEIKSADKIPADEADKKVAAIQQVLTPDQKAALDAMQPQRGGGGGGYGGGRGGGPPGGGPPGGMMGGGPPGGGGMMGGGGRPDPDRPFASENNKKALDGLIASVSKS